MAADVVAAELVAGPAASMRAVRCAAAEVPARVAMNSRRLTPSSEEAASDLSSGSSGMGPARKCNRHAATLVKRSRRVIPIGCSQVDLTHLVATQGYSVVCVVVALESMGLPLPGETTLVTAAIYAGTTHRLNIWLVIAAAAVGAIAGDSVGYWIGRIFGHRLLLRYSRVLRMTPRRIKLGQYLFQRHGGKVVFLGRFF